MSWMCFIECQLRHLTQNVANKQREREREREATWDALCYTWKKEEEKREEEEEDRKKFELFFGPCLDPPFEGFSLNHFKVTTHTLITRASHFCLFFLLLFSFFPNQSMGPRLDQISCSASKLRGFVPWLFLPFPLVVVVTWISHPMERDRVIFPVCKSMSHDSKKHVKAKVDTRAKWGRKILPALLQQLFNLDEF